MSGRAHLWAAGLIILRVDRKANCRPDASLTIDTTIAADDGHG